MSQKVPYFVLGASILTVACAIACGSDGDSKFGDGNGNGASSGNSGANGNLFTNSSGDGGDNASSGGPGGNCNAPVDMYIMLDRSGSMVPRNGSNNDGNIGDTATKWERSITALSGYFKSAGSKDQAAALQFFPLESHQSNRCANGNGYEAPRSPGTEFTTLPSNSFDAILNAEAPTQNDNLGTPTEAAIRGMTRFTAANRRPGRVTIGILITDGNPNGCNEDREDLSAMLAAHLNATKIRTYVIGMEGASFDNVERIAQGGGSPEHPDTVGALTDACGTNGNTCRHWNVGDGNPAAFEAALKAIQESADGCKEGGGTINPPK